MLQVLREGDAADVIGVGFEVAGHGLVVQRVVLVEHQHAHAVGRQRLPDRVGRLPRRQRVGADHQHLRLGGQGVRATPPRVKATPRFFNRAFTDPLGVEDGQFVLRQLRLGAAVRGR